MSVAKKKRRGISWGGAPKQTDVEKASATLWRRICKQEFVSGRGEAKITMRFWIIGAMVAVVGLIIGLIGMGN